MNSVAIVDSGTNYVKFGNGLLIQWGTISTSSQTVTVTFSQPFIENNYALSLVAQSSFTSTSYACMEDPTATSFSLHKRNTAVKWIAIGY